MRQSGIEAYKNSENIIQKFKVRPEGRGGGRTIVLPWIRHWPTYR